MRSARPRPRSPSCSAAAEASDGSDRARRSTYSEDGTVAQIDVPTPGNGNDAESYAALDELRDDIDPGDGRRASRASTVNVSGDAAQSEDFRATCTSRLPLIFAFVFALAFLLLLVTFRSIVIPIKAILLNLLSVGAAYGVLVLVFQHGHGESLLGFTSNGGVTTWLPLFLFVVLFGLSMDYHVFILSRVREALRPRHDDRRGGQPGNLDDRGHRDQRRDRDGRRLLVFVTLEFLDFKEIGRRPRGCGPDRRDDHPRRAAPGVDEGARRLELVPAELARMAAAVGTEGDAAQDPSKGPKPVPA